MQRETVGPALFDVELSIWISLRSLSSYRAKVFTGICPCSISQTNVAQPYPLLKLRPVRCPSRSRNSLSQR